MCQHSPGLQIYKKETLLAILPRVEKLVASQKRKWGLDLAVLKLASREGELMPVRIDEHSWVERRPLAKFVTQAVDSARVLIDIHRKDYLS